MQIDDLDLDDIVARLKQEFPKRYVSFSVHVDTGPHTRQGMQTLIYAENTKHVPCSSVEDGIKRLHQAIKKKEGTNAD